MFFNFRCAIAGWDFINLVIKPKRVAEGYRYYMDFGIVFALDVETCRARIAPRCSKSENGEYPFQYTYESQWLFQKAEIEQKRAHVLM